MKTRSLWLTVVLFVACNAISSVKDLGAGYYIDTDQILFTEKKHYDGSGIRVIPPRIAFVGFNTDFIIVSSKNNLDVTTYWIIIKNDEKKRLKYVSNDELSSYYIYSNVHGPLNDNEFKEARKNYLVPNDLELKPVE